MRINTNVSALNTLRSLGKTESAVSSSMAKLSSGFRINKSGDDAAGLGIANKLNADVRASSQASRNAEQAGSVLQIMDGATQSVQSILERMKELATQSASDSVDSAARTRINQEFSDLRSEIGRIVDTTKFQGNKLLDGGFGNSVLQTSAAVGLGQHVQRRAHLGHERRPVHVDEHGSGQADADERHDHRDGDGECGRQADRFVLELRYLDRHQRGVQRRWHGGGAGYGWFGPVGCSGQHGWRVHDQLVSGELHDVRT